MFILARVLLLLLLLPVSMHVQAQNGTIEEEAEEIHRIIEEMPEFPGGEEQLFAFLGKNIAYPSQARENGVSGRVFVSFVVEKDGSISNIEIVRGIGAGCDEELVRVIKLMPNWSPGMINGKPVRVQFNLPVFFNLGPEHKTVAEFAGGKVAFSSFLKKYKFIYANGATINADAENFVDITFQVNTDGTISDVKIVAQEKKIKKRAEKMMSKMPNWKPKLQNKFPVVSEVSFRLRSRE